MGFEWQKGGDWKDVLAGGDFELFEDGFGIDAQNNAAQCDGDQNSDLAHVEVA